MRCIKAFMLLMLLPALAGAEGVLTPAANPPAALTTVSVSGIPFIKASSGSMADNGAVSAMTALPKTYSNGAYLYLPASAISAGSAAGWYWFVGSSTTAGTVYNCQPTVAADGTPSRCTNTAFATTGPGAFTGVTGAVTAVTIPIPANLMGVNGRVDFNGYYTQNNSGGNKTPTLTFGGTTCFGLSFTTATTAIVDCHVTNRGLKTAQSLGYWYATNTSSVAAMAAADAAVDTTATANVLLRVNTAVATDHQILEEYRVVVYTRN